MRHCLRVRPGTLLALRVARRLSVAQLATDTGLDPSAIYRLEQGLLRSGPRMDTLCRLATALGVEVEALLEQDAV